MATAATQDARDLLAGGEEQWGEDLEGVEEEQPVQVPKKKKRRAPPAKETQTKKSRTVNGGKKKKRPEPIVEEESDSSSSEEDSDSDSSSDSDADSSVADQEVDERRTFRHYRVPVEETIDSECARVVRAYHTAQDQIDGFGFSKGVPRPLVDAAGAKRYAEGGGAFIRTGSITNHMKHRAGIQSMEKKAAEKAARFGEDVAAALTSQVLLFTKSRKQQTISPEDVHNAATLMGIDNLVRC